MDRDSTPPASAAREAVDWMLALHDAVRGDGDLDALVLGLQEWVIAAPENHLAFREVREVWGEMGKLIDARWPLGEVERLSRG